MGTVHALPCNDSREQRLSRLERLFWKSLTLAVLLLRLYAWKHVSSLQLGHLRVGWLGAIKIICKGLRGDYHFFPNFFPKSLDSFQKFGKVWKSWKKVWKTFSKLYLLETTILMPLYRVLYFQHVSKSTRRGSWHERSLNRANDLSFSKKLSHPNFFQNLFSKLFSKLFTKLFSRVEID
jgi:hypothetical protein